MVFRSLMLALCLSLVLCISVAQARTVQVRPGPDNSADELYYACLNAQQGDEIVIAEGLYIWNSSLYFDGPIILEGKFDITIRGEGDVYILCTDPYASPISIATSAVIRLENLFAGHLLERGYCSGNVITISDSSDISVTGCVLHGSGVVALAAFSSKDLLVTRTALAGCTMAATDLYDVFGLVIEDSLLADNTNEYFESPLFSFSTPVRLDIRRCLIVNNTSESLTWEQPGSFTITDSIFASNQLAYQDLAAYLGRDGNVSGKIGEVCAPDYSPLAAGPVAETFNRLAPKDKAATAPPSDLPDLPELASVAERYQRFLRRLEELESNPNHYPQTN